MDRRDRRLRHLLPPLRRYPALRPTRQSCDVATLERRPGGGTRQSLVLLRSSQSAAHERCPSADRARPGVWLFGDGSAAGARRTRRRDGSRRMARDRGRSEEHTSELQSHLNLVCRLLLEKKKNKL